MTVRMARRAAPMDTTTTIPILARHTGITGRIGSIMASFWALVPGTAGAGAVAADTGATIGAVADTAGVAEATVTGAAMVIAAATDTAEVMVAEGMDITAATADGPTRAAAIMAAADTMVVAVADTTAVAVADTTAAVVVDSMAAAVGAASMVEAAADMVAVVATGNRQAI
jgi:hypothetical protein